MALVTGDECGLLKLADLHRNTATRIDDHEVQARSRGILKIATSAVDATTGATTFHAARRDGALETWRRSATEEPFSRQSTAAGLAPSTTFLSSIGRGLLTCSAQGRAQLTSLNSRRAGDVGTWDLSEGRNNYDVTCGGVVDDALFVGGRECELTRWDLETRQPSWKVSDQCPFMSVVAR